VRRATAQIAGHDQAIEWRDEGRTGQLIFDKRDLRIDLTDLRRQHHHGRPVLGVQRLPMLARELLALGDKSSVLECKLPIIQSAQDLTLHDGVASANEALHDMAVIRSDHGALHDAFDDRSGRNTIGARRLRKAAAPTIIRAINFTPG
jgi:hypothetical protein